LKAVTIPAVSSLDGRVLDNVGDLRMVPLDEAMRRKTPALIAAR
jgi:hypothetical protein